MKPILFNTEMVRAILDGRKTVTRRVCKDGGEYTVPDISFLDCKRRTYAVHSYADKAHTEQLSTAERTCPICPGDILYMRETWCQPAKDIFWYKADSPVQNINWKPSIHMPREAARLFLRVTDVRVERLQDISDKDLIREGEAPYIHVDGSFNREATKTSYLGTWNSTIKPADRAHYGWDANPWVWVISFERISKEEALHG